MKKGNLKTAAKARKAIRASIEDNLSESLKEFVVSLGYDPRKAKLQIAEASRNIAKRIAKKVKIDDLKITAENALSTDQGNERWGKELGSDDVNLKILNSGLLLSQGKGKKAVRANSKEIKSSSQVDREKSVTEEPDLEIQIGTS